MHKGRKSAYEKKKKKYTWELANRISVTTFTVRCRCLPWLIFILSSDTFIETYIHVRESRKEISRAK